MTEKPLDLENPYPEDIFPEISEKEWKKIDELLKRELGFPLDRVAGNINRKMWNNMKDWFTERVKKACDFYLKYKDKPQRFLDDNPDYKKELIDNCSVFTHLICYGEVERILTNEGNSLFIVKECYRRWLFKLAFKGEKG